MAIMHPTKTERLPWRNIDGRVVVIHPKMGEVHELNPVGSYLWEHLDGNCSLEQLAEDLAQNFEVDLEEALEDTRSFFALLAEHGLVARQG